MTEPLPLQYVKSYEVGGRTYHYHRITKERLPDDETERFKRVLEINAARKVGPGEADKRKVKRLRRSLEKTIRALERTASTPGQRVSSALALADALGRIADDALVRPDGYGEWSPPMPAPPRLRGVYRLMREGRTTYIGQSVNILGRVLGHTKDKIFDQFSFALVDGGKRVLSEIEAALIILDKPPENSLTGLPKWTPEEAQAVLDKYRAAVSAEDEEVA